MKFGLKDKKLGLVTLISLVAITAGLMVWQRPFQHSPAPEIKQSPQVVAPHQTQTDKELLAQVADPAIRRHLEAQVARSQRLTTRYSPGDITTILVLDITNTEVDRFHGVQKQGDKVLSEVIGIGDTLYTKNPQSGAWKKGTTKDSNSIKNSLAVQALTYTNELKQQRPTFHFKKVGTEKCGDLECDKYEMKKDKNAPKPAIVWIDTTEHLLRKLELTPIKTTMTTTYQYEDLPTIQTPPVN